MRDTSPAFQPDRPGSPGFQLAQDAGFQTEGALALGDVRLVANVTSHTAFSAGMAHLTVEGDVRVVVGIAALTRGPQRDLFGGGVVWTMPVRKRYTGDLAVVVAVQSPTGFRAAPPRPRAHRAKPVPRRVAVAGCASAPRVTVHAHTRFHDYVREVVVPDDEDVWLLILGGRR